MSPGSRTRCGICRPTRWLRCCEPCGRNAPQGSPPSGAIRRTNGRGGSKRRYAIITGRSRALPMIRIRPRTLRAAGNLPVGRCEDRLRHGRAGKPDKAHHSSKKIAKSKKSFLPGGDPHTLSGTVGGIMQNLGRKLIRECRQRGLAMAQPPFRAHLVRPGFLLSAFASLTVISASAAPNSPSTASAPANGRYQVIRGPDINDILFKNLNTVCHGTLNTERDYAQCMLSTGNAVIDPEGNRYAPRSHLPQTAPSLAANAAPRANSAMTSNWENAGAADRAHNYSEAMRWWLAVIKEGTGIHYQNPNLTADDIRDNELGSRAVAEYQIGYYNELGLGVPQDYTKAAYWYQQSIDNHVLLSGRAIRRLGVLYAYGLGVPKDRQKAREVFMLLPDNGIVAVNLLDAGRLPRNPDDINTAAAQYGAEQKAKKEAEEEAHWQATLETIRRASSSSAGGSRSQSSGSSGPGWYACHHILGAMGGMMGCSPW